jgi:hypothetical protein
MSGQSSVVTPAQQTAEQQKAEQQKAEQALVDRTADQQTIRTGLFPAPRFLRRVAKAR